VIPIWRRPIEASRKAFIAGFLEFGFIETSPPDCATDTVYLEGQIPSGSTGLDSLPAVVIEVPPDYPFSPPQVRCANEPDRLTWHLQPGGQLCLWHRGHHTRLEWLTSEAVAKRIQDWWAHRNESWPHDAGALDLQYYFAKDSSLLYTCSSASGLSGQVTIEKRGEGWYHWTRWQPRGGRDEVFKKRQLRRIFAEAVDIGMLTQPVWDWPTIAACISPNQANRIEQEVLRRGSGFLLLRYQRPGPEGIREGVLGVIATNEKGQMQINAVETAEDSPSVLMHRAGPDWEKMSTASVLVVGVGAVGSFVADELARGGIGRMTLVDADRLRPGNSTRHLCGPSQINQPKVTAVRDVLVEHTGMTLQDINVLRTQLEPDLAFKLLPKHDIVIDATADYSVEWLLEKLAIDLDIPVVHVGLHRQGGLIRIDRSSRYSDANRRLDEVPAIETTDTAIREVGCMHPVSLTPPHAVHAAAAYATATVLDTLTDRWELPDSAIHVLTPQPDQPYDRVGTIIREQ